MKKYKYGSDEFLTNMEMNEKELEEMAKMFSDIYDKDDVVDPTLNKAYQYLDKVSYAKDEKEALKYIEKALEVYPDCFEAKIMLASYESNPIKVISILKDALKREKEILKEDGFFDHDRVSEFSGMFDTMPYIYGMYNLACLYAGVGMINKAIDVAKEILKLDYQDSSGTRYLLMALYAYKEDENNLKKLYKKYSEENLHMLVPLLVYYYKQMNFDEAKKYLKKIFKCNKHFDTIFDEIDENMLEGYTLGDLSEVADTGALCSFLLNTVPALEEFVKHPDEF